MKIEFIVVGKTKSKEIQACINDYEQRIKHYCDFSITVIPELKNTKKLSQEQIKTAEGEQIIKNIKSKSFFVLLDERGLEFRSLDFAAWLENKQITTNNITFAIGGAYGFSKTVYESAQTKISLSKMTFSHQLVRLLFLEQLYRAFTIVRNEPYHHE